MKTLFLVTITFIKVKWLPDLNLLSWCIIIVMLDFVSGIMKARKKNEIRTSRGFRQTLVKIWQYGSAILLSIVLGNTIVAEPGGKGHLALDLFQNGLLLFILWVEATSICENIYAMNPKSKFSKYFIRPALNVLTFQLVNNPATQTLTTNEKTNDNAIGTTDSKLP